MLKACSGMLRRFCIAKYREFLDQTLISLIECNPCRKFHKILKSIMAVSTSAKGMNDCHKFLMLFGNIRYFRIAEYLIYVVAEQLESFRVGLRIINKQTRIITP